ncbi:MraY family glycosyltransferase [Howardella ureilytica]|nr:phospho-N-acetylmuramoyl-pentapeptide-transferase [Lachnospiraceae bacterium]MDY2956379.1 phospho-N-acetylmuramoyl-pentapeptide-transferase [Lachnospiraceae bacterium]
MFAFLVSEQYQSIVIFVGIVVSFVAAFFLFGNAKRFLPRDAGREYAVNGAKSKGKARGAGLILILTFISAVILFVDFTPEILIYLLLLTAEMVAGFLDDSSSVSWGERKKAMLDLGISVIFAITYLVYNPSTFNLSFINVTVHIHPVLYAILIVILVFVSINVTNCADGVDGLCGSQCIIAFGTVIAIMHKYGIAANFSHMLVMLLAVLGAYMWFNSSPSSILMGDAGSRALGFLLAVSCIKLGHPVLFLLIAFILIVDGGLGLAKLTFTRILKRPVMTGIRTPIHDHFRKNLGWSDTHVVNRFAIIQAVIAMCLIFTVVQ